MNRSKLIVEINDSTREVKENSLIEFNGDLYKSNSDESITDDGIAWSSISNGDFFYIYFNAGTFFFSDDDPTFDSDKMGFYHSDDRAVCRCTKTSGDLVVLGFLYRYWPYGECKDLTVEGKTTFLGRRLNGSLHGSHQIRDLYNALSGTTELGPVTWQPIGMTWFLTGAISHSGKPQKIVFKAERVSTTEIYVYAAFSDAFPSSYFVCSRSYTSTMNFSLAW
jgi:hypothetical protein